MTAPDLALTVDAETGGTALARCVACPAQAFADEYWGRESLLSRAADLPADFSDLFSPAAVDELVSERGLRTPFLRMAKDGGVLAASTYTRGGGAGAGVADQAADDRILAALGDGATLVLQGLHRTWPPLVAYAARLAEQLGHPVQINAYITPPQSQGFSPHHDVHDVFVLQVSGRKHWVIHDPVVADPLDNQPFGGFKAQIADRVAEPARIDTVLEPGDALYLPRGTVHSAQALGETSIHLTIGVHPLTRFSLARLLLDAAQDDPELRVSLPMGVDLGDPDVLGPHVAATVDALREALTQVDPDGIAGRVARDLGSRTRPEAIAPLRQLGVADALTLETPLAKRGALRVRVDETTGPEGDARLRIAMLDRSVDMPADLAEAVSVAVDGAVFTPSELPGLEPSEQLTLARRLVREGVLVPA